MFHLSPKFLVVAALGVCLSGGVKKSQATIFEKVFPGKIADPVRLLYPQLRIKEVHAGENGAKAGYRLIGTGKETVVLVPGSFANHRQWNLLLPFLARSLGSNYQFVLVDYPGVGLSNNVLDNSSDKPMPRMAKSLGKSVIQVLDHLQIKKANLFGWSLGSMVAATVASQYPERVASVFNYGTPYLDANPKTINAFAKEWVPCLTSFNNQIRSKNSDAFLDDKKVEAMLNSLYASSTKRSLVKEKIQHLGAKILGKMTGHLFEGNQVKSMRGLLEKYAKMNPATAQRMQKIFTDLKESDIPVALVVGTKDATTPPEMTRAAKEGAPRFTTFELPGRGHSSFAVNPYAAKELAELYHQWLAQLPSKSAP